MEVLHDLGHEIVPLNTQTPWDKPSWLSRRVQQGLSRGPTIKQINQQVAKLVGESKPDFLWAEKQEYLEPDTLQQIRRQGIRTLHFTPDPYFTLSWKRTPLMDACMPLFDYVVTAKQYELTEYEATCQKVIYMPLGFSLAVHRPYFPINRQQVTHFQSDVGFLGGWEPRRERLLDSIVTHTNSRLKIWGYSWDHVRDGRWTPRRAYRMRLLSGNDDFQIRQNDRLARALQGGEVYGDQYAWALSGAKIGVGFLRKVCPDQHTTRTFEIPACGSLLLADRTVEHQDFFVEGVEADFFSSAEELTEKVCFYLNNEKVRARVAYNGYLKCQSAGYSYHSRMREVLGGINRDFS